MKNLVCACEKIQTNYGTLIVTESNTDSDNDGTQYYWGYAESDGIEYTWTKRGERITAAIVG